ncbi:MATE family efflux transporter [Treponema medium]|uniref:Multidrug export protein MepA n=2 Tax=Treponema medium TaxID=58231 RepID=A0AA87NT53_TREMD|nr:MATE family efflux transporter [Treponema medium]EPF28965.1 MATE efflux family protein [Treponema medium ATCC 700293]QSH97330.1 MATE family efflux transporter [Treponema medium]
MDTKELRRFNILTKPIFPLLIKTAIPTIIGMLISVIYNVTDTFFVGQLHNRSMIAAIGVVFSFVSVIQAIGFWYGYGSGNVMSKNIGKHDYAEAEIISSIGIVIAIATGTVIAIAAYIFVVPLAKLIGGSASQDVLTFTVQYLKIIIISIPFSLYAVTVYNQLRLCGNVRDGMIGLLSGMLTNMVLDPLLMFPLNMGFIGAGYATLIGQIIGCIVLTALAQSRGNILVSIKTAHYSKVRMYHILVGGLPNFSRQAITGAALVLLNVTAAKYGESMIAALTISSKIVAVAFMIMIGWGQGFQPICAMNYGAQQYERVKRAFITTVTVGTIFLTAASIILFIFAEQCIHLMSNDNDVVTTGVSILRMQCFSLPLLGIFAVSSMFMQNIGNYFSALLISISRQGFFYVPLLYLLPAVYGKTGIYLLQPISDFLSFLFAVAVVYRWYRKNSPSNSCVY